MLLSSLALNPYCPEWIISVSGRYENYETTASTYNNIELWRLWHLKSWSRRFYLVRNVGKWRSVDEKVANSSCLTGARCDPKKSLSLRLDCLPRSLMPERTAEGFSGRKRSPRSATIALSSGAITSSPILCFLIALDPFDTIPCQNGGRKSEVFHRTRWITRPPLVIPLIVSEHDYKLYFRIATQPW